MLFLKKLYKRWKLSFNRIDHVLGWSVDFNRVKFFLLNLKSNSR
jgi:hypothetical protein